MSAITGVKVNLLEALGQMFATGEDIKDKNYKLLNNEQKASQQESDEIMNKSTGVLAANTGKVNEKGLFVKKMDTIPELGKAMREKRDQVVKEAQGKGIEL